MLPATPEEIWKAVLCDMELSLSKAHFTTWFKNTSIVSRDQNSVTVSVPNGFVKEWLENKFNKQIIYSIRKLSNEIREVRYIIGQPKPEPIRQDFSKMIVDRDLQEQTSGEQNQEIDKTTSLNKKYSFNSFIVGSANELAFACAQSVSQCIVGNLPKPYNPLFIYGGVGLGKTHLVQSIGNAVLEKAPERKVLYASGEKMVSAIVEGIRNRTIEDLKNLYSGLDLLIIDDIQFIAGKEKMQEIVFTIFNEIHNKNRQVVMTSDRPPTAIPAIEERLLSRLVGGMLADINAPDFETRVAILKAKSAEKGVVFSDEVLSYIGTHIQKNIRELEGALNRVIALSQIYNRVPDLKETKNILNAYLAVPYRKTSPQIILKTVADFYNISPADLTKRSRKKEVVKPRQVAMYLLREEIKLSFPDIGQKLGGRDHSTVIHACEKIKREEQADEPLKNELTMIRQRVYDSFE
ncbi:MAG TPA: chromosomal replication initiator protein DnaA [Candidatus Paceibacterota bacterium]|nr:chromosomal replication initiator protein DnaA [Candidatus Paceibacterota bacterium]